MTRCGLILLLAVVLTLGPACDDAMVFDLQPGKGDGGTQVNKKKDAGKKPVPKKDAGGVAKADAKVTGGDLASSADIRPSSGKKEICGNGIDDNNNSLVDEGCGCKKGATQSCYPWPKKLSQGICVLGRQTCTGTAEFGTWGSCTGYVLPKKEVCGNKIDEDCDGRTPACPPKCGDGTCNGTETCQTCPQDCGKCCGNGTCESTYGETCKTCQPDCGKCCGNGTCESAYGETCKTCQPDCGKCPPSCGDGTCDPGETCNSCPQDCGKCCGNHRCDSSFGENCQNCVADCGRCCGNGTCEPALGETCSTCPGDCGACKPYCGDKKCNGTENCASCPGDCGACPTKCEYFTFGVSARAVDIVFIVDQSGSMNQEIAGIKQNLNNFSNYINGTSIDYHVIMVAKRGTGTYDICIPPPLGGASCADSSRFKQIDISRPPYKYTKIESWDSLYAYQFYVNDIESFMRPKSLRQIVEISDDDSRGSFPTGPAFHAWITGRTGYNDYMFHSIVGLTTGSGVSSVGNAYIHLSNVTGGIKEHISTANWNTVFQHLGKTVAGVATKQYSLSGKPLSNKVDVWYGSSKVGLGVDYDYDSAGNHITLKGSMPAANTKIKVCYQHIP